MKRKKTPIRSGSFAAKLAYYTFIIAAIVYLVQSILSHFGINSNILHTIQTIVLVCLFVVTGIAGYAFVRNKSFLKKLIYLICAGIIVVAVILPII